MRTVLFSLDFQTQLNELSRVARLVGESGALQPTICFGSSADNAPPRGVAACRGEGWPVVFFQDFVVEADRASAANAFTRFRDRCRRWFRARAGSARLFDFAASYLEESDALRRTKAAANRLLDLLTPSLLVVPEDGLGANRPLIWAARKRGLHVLVVPYEFSTTKQPLEAILSAPDRDSTYSISSGSSRLARFVAPRWSLRDADGRQWLRYPPARILAHEVHGIAPLLPWQVHGGRADALAVESPRMNAHYRSQGVPSQKLHLVGAAYDDALYRARENRETLRLELLKRLSLPLDRPILVCSVPGDYVAARRDRVEFADYDELITFWIETLTTPATFNLIVKPHPAVPDSTRERMRVAGVRVIEEDIAGLIPLSDVLVTSVSSIIRMAIASGVPVLNYDVYRFRYPDYLDVAAVVHTDTREEFRLTAHRIMTDPSFLASLRERQVAVAVDWGLQDGRTGDRILALIHKLARPNA